MSTILVTKLSPEITQITLNDPENLNAMGDDMAKEFREECHALIHDQEIRVLVIRGAGRAFSAGGRLDMLEKKMSVPSSENKRIMLEFYRSFLAIKEVKVPVIGSERLSEFENPVLEKLQSFFPL